MGTQDREPLGTRDPRNHHTRRRKCVHDGVQARLHPEESACRVWIAVRVHAIGRDPNDAPDGHRPVGGLRPFRFPSNRTSHPLNFESATQKDRHPSILEASTSLPPSRSLANAMRCAKPTHVRETDRRHRPSAAVRDVRVRMVETGGGVDSCLWTDDAHTSSDDVRRRRIDRRRRTKRREGLKTVPKDPYRCCGDSCAPLGRRKPTRADRN